MTPATLGLIALFGALGAVTRFVLKEKLVHRAIPLMGLLVANLAGSAVAGALLALPSSALTFAMAVGFCGALTTFSTIAYYLIPAGGERRLGRLSGIAAAQGGGSVIALWVTYALVTTLV